MAKLIDGRRLAERRRKALRKRVHPGTRLGIITATDNPATSVYVRQKQRAAAAVGIDVEVADLGPRASRKRLLDTCRSFNRSKRISAYIVQLPLPRSVDVREVIDAIDPAKDADGLTAVNLGRMVAGSPGVIPATPKGVLSLLQAHRVPLRGTEITIIGKGRLTGAPLAALLSARGATVTTCDVHTKDLAAAARRADVLVVAAGAPGLVTAPMVKRGAVVIDIGITRVGDDLLGDVDFEAVAKKAGAITPVPGGVGPMTVVSLLENVVALQRSAG